MPPSKDSPVVAAPSGAEGTESSQTDLAVVRTSGGGVGFTPGPWRALCKTHYTRVVRDRQARGDQVGSVQICHIAGPAESDLRPFNRERWESDARLIAAAPELYEALKPFAALLQAHNDKGSDAIPVFGINDSTVTVGHLRKARAALKRARGE